MARTDIEQDSTRGGASHFTTTHWSVVLAAGQTASPQSAAALEKLCRTYWYPLYAFARRQGHTAPDAQDLTQGFFASLLQRNFLKQVDRQKGKFRSFLLAALQHYIADERDRATAVKRGGGQKSISLDDEQAEALYLQEPAAEATAEKLFEHRWALALLAQALARLREEFVAAGQAREFDHLKAFLCAPTADGAYDAVAAELKMPVATVAVKVHRLRLRYGELIRAEIAHTVANPTDIDEEMERLFAAVSL